MKTVAFVPAKGTSDRINDKNRRILDGEFLFKRKLRQLVECDEIDEVYLDTESEEIASLADDLPVRWLRRDPQLATNATDGHELFANACRQVEADIYIQALCTAPFVDADTLGRAVRALRDDPSADSLVAVRREAQYRWQDGRPVYGEGRIPNSIDLEPAVVETMSLYMVRREPGSASPTRRFGAKPVLFELTPREAIDVNVPPDLALAEQVCAGERAEHNQRLSAMLPHLSSAIFADLAIDFGQEVALPSNIRPVSPGKFLGRAKTLALQPVTDGHWRGIYDALDSYDFARPGDVIVVSNDVPTRAYFGELNASLARRAGAVGVVIDGLTRDTPAVQQLSIPVYAHGAHPRDIKHEGTVKSMNRPVTVGNVTVRNGDYVLGDADGVVVIPADMWPRFCEAAWDAVEREWDIRRAVARGAGPAEIVRRFGAF